MRFYTLCCFTFLLAFNLTGQVFYSNCGPDTLGYTRAKATANSEYTLSVQSNFLSYGQYYDAPQGITVSGLCFYGRAIGNTNATVTVRGMLYDFNPGDSLPFGAPIVQGSVEVDTSYHNGNMDMMRYCLNFSEPVTMYNGYVLTLETDSTLPIKIYGSSNGDGGFERLALAKFGSPWNKMISFAADIDFHIEPIIDYSLSAELTFADDSLCTPNVLYIGAASPGVAYHRMYNQRAFNGNVLDGFNITVLGTTLPHTADTFFSVNQTGPVALEFTNDIIGWTHTCSVTAYDTAYVLDFPAADYTTIGNGLTVDFFANSPFAPTLLWDMGDGTTYTNLQQVSHTFAGAGSYTVTLVTQNDCGSDTIAAQFVVPFVGVDEQLAQTPSITLFPNPANEKVTLRSSATIVNISIYNSNGSLVASISGNGNQTVELPISNYAPGMYFTCVSDAKGQSATGKLIVY